MAEKEKLKRGGVTGLFQKEGEYKGERSKVNSHHKTKFKDQKRRKRKGRQTQKSFKQVLQTQWLQTAIRKTKSWQGRRSLG